MNTVVLLILLFAIFGATAYVITIFNSLIALKTDIDKAWANIDVLLKQRHDELTKLLDVCKGYMDYERDTLLRITQARSHYQQAVNMDQKAQANQSMFGSTAGCFSMRLMPAMGARPGVGRNGKCTPSPRLKFGITEHGKRLNERSPAATTEMKATFPKDKSESRDDGSRVVTLRGSMERNGWNVRQ